MKKTNLLTRSQLKAFSEYDIIGIYQMSFELRLALIARKYDVQESWRFQRNVDNTLAYVVRYFSNKFGIDEETSRKIVSHELKNTNLRVFGFIKEEINVYDLQGHLGWKEVIKTHKIEDLIPLKEDVIALWNGHVERYIMMERKYAEDN